MSRPPDSESRDDLAFKREEYDLERDKTQDRDARIMKWIVFALAVSGLVVSFAGTLLGWNGASHTFTALLSLLGGNLIRPLGVLLPGRR